MNKVFLIGRVVADPELKFTQGDGKAVTTFKIAVDRYKKGEADFFSIVVWGKQAESTATYTAKGKLIGISGRLQTRNYEAKDGSKRYVTEVIADEVQFLEWADKPTNADNRIDTGNNSGVSELEDNCSPFNDPF